MVERFDDPFKELEQCIMEDMRKIYSEKTIDHFLNPRNLGRITDTDGVGMITDPRGSTMEIHLKVKDSKVIDASFW
ncbi:MAG TPA: iron-sulfur cluster assembly scaffold protein, partial [Dehalococcoidia bacterium]|nr:iron-sulfur cluster assembly scaffold protein [Dehalococcoidia bacterium]